MLSLRLQLVSKMKKRVRRLKKAVMISLVMSSNGSASNDAEVY